jgi:hypothetical protein
MAIDVVVVLLRLLPLGCLYPSCYRVSYNMISIRTLSLLVYFTDIVIYALENTL